MTDTDDNVIQFPVRLVRDQASWIDAVIRETRALTPESFEALPELEGWMRTEARQLYDKYKPFSYTAQVHFPVLHISQQEAKELIETFQASGEDVANAATRHFNEIIFGLAAEVLGLKLAVYLQSRS